MIDGGAPGDLVHLSVFGKSTISIGSYEVACDLLDKRSANYSDRPKLVIGELYVVVRSLVLSRLIASTGPISTTGTSRS